MTRLCFDYDALLYKVGFAAEERSIVATHKNTKEQHIFKNRTEFWGLNRKEGWLAEYNKDRDSPYMPEEWDVEDVQQLRSNFLVPDILRTTINSTMKHIGVRGLNNVYGWIGKGKTFRHERASIMEYKGGARKEALKPLALGQIEDLLVRHYNAKYATDGLEADDWLCIDSVVAWDEWIKTKHQKDRLIVITPDKDARQCEKSHLFNPDEMVLPMTINGYGKLYWKELPSGKKLSGHGRAWLYAQICIGDQTDHYTPNKLSGKRFGEKACYELLSKCTNDKEALSAVVSQYKLWYPGDVTFNPWYAPEETKTVDWLYIAEEMWTLARMRRYVDDVVSFKEVLDIVGVEY